MLRTISYVGWPESLLYQSSTKRWELGKFYTVGPGDCRKDIPHLSNKMDLILPMDLSAKIRTLPTSAGVYLYKNAEGEVIYVGKAKNLRSRVASYFHEGRIADAKTGTLVREAVDVDYIVVANNKEALALENHLIKQKQPRFNILLRDDKTYPYVKLTLGERFPRVYVTRRLAQRRQQLLRTVLSGKPSVSHRGLDPSPFSGALVQGGSDAFPSSALPAVLHQALSGAVCGGSDDS